MRRSAWIGGFIAGRVARGLVNIARTAANTPKRMPEVEEPVTPAEPYANEGYIPWPVRERLIRNAEGDPIAYEDDT